jgi:hypothetical protein
MWDVVSHMSSCNGGQWQAPLLSWGRHRATVVDKNAYLSVLSYIFVEADGLYWLLSVPPFSAHPHERVTAQLQAQKLAACKRPKRFL